MGSSSKRRPFSIKMLLADGTPDGLKLVEKSNWNGIAVMCARADYPQARSRKEFNRPGVYVLIGPSTAGAGRQTLYIGQADHARDRLDQHLRGKADWTHLVLFVSRDDALNKAHVHYLESQLYALAKQTRRADLSNGNAPSAPFLSEADRADAEAFMDDMLLIYPLLGVNAFQPPDEPAPLTLELTKPGVTTTPSPITTTLPLITTTPPPVTTTLPPESRDTGRPRLHFKTKGVDAEGEETEDGFVVFAGAIGRPTPRQSIHTQPNLVRIREELRASGILVEEGGNLRLTKDQTFTTPSAAAGVLIGGAVNGRTAWQDAQGRTLKSLQERALEGPPDGR
ncbi:MAG: GIY-YIG nuclease family protein [Thermomicrobiales bacterium]